MIYDNKKVQIIQLYKVQSFLEQQKGFETLF